MISSFILGIFSSVFFLLNTAFWSVLLYVVLPFRFLLPFPAARKATGSLMVWVAESWTTCNSWMLRNFMGVRWNVEGLGSLRRNASYLVCANHQSWVDIVVLQYVFNRRIPFLRFFIKQELLYVPLLGGAWWTLDYPVMKRYSKEYLAKHPEKRGEDLRTTQKACEKFKGSPVSILNFLEGTRFTPSKHETQKSPYRNLLKPKRGGVFFVIEAMGDQFDSLLDVTIFYPQGRPSLWSLLSGRVRRAEIVVRALPIPREFLGLKDTKTRESFQQWIQTIWSEKDRLLEELKARSVASGASGLPASF